MLLLHVLVAWNTRDLVRKGYPDFTIFYAAGRMVRQGLAKDLYDPRLQFQIQQQFSADVSIRHGALPYNHPPFEALFFAPFTRLAYLPAYLLWDALNALALLALPWLLRPWVPWLRRIPPAFVTGASLAFFPVFVGLLQGQDIIFLLLLFSLTFVSLKRQADFSAGCWLGLGLFRFHLVLPFVCVLLLRKRKKVIAGFLLIALALGLISMAVVGWTAAVHYPAYVWHVETNMGHGAIVPADMPNLRGFLTLVLTSRTPKLVRDTVVALLSIGLLLFAYSRWDPAERNLDLSFSLALVMTVLVSYHANAYDLSLLFLPLILLAGYFRQTERPFDWRRAALVAPAIVLFLSPLYMILWLRFGQLNLLAPVLLLWEWGIAGEISRRAAGREELSAKQSGDLSSV